MTEDNSNSDLAIHVQNIGKMYRIFDRPQDRLKDGILWRWGKRYGREFWALKDISFEVKKGESVGIIGRNGSGKSTLLQIIAGTLQTTTGSVQVNGRVAALLELGSGFNPEYTGRENVYMNAAILGLTREETDNKFDEIAAFADIGQFLDQPVKTYSSGMMVRLAFAVSVCTDPEILIVDEALSVGDIFFRQKCHTRMNALRSKGVSVILVSHDMIEIEQFCDRALLLSAGCSLVQGSAAEAVRHYYLLDQPQGAVVAAPSPGECATPSSPSHQSFDWPAPDAFLDLSNVTQVSNGWARCTAAAICDKNNRGCKAFEQGDAATFYYEFELLHDIEAPVAGLMIQNDRGVIVHGKNTLEYGSDVSVGHAKGSILRFRQNIELQIQVGEYTFEVGLAALSRSDYEARAACSHQDLTGKLLRLCHLPQLGQFTIVFRRQAKPVILLHHGVANLPGGCEMTVARTAPA